MEKEIKDYIKILNEKKEKYPNITMLWLNIINYRIKMLNYSLKEMKEMCKKLELLEKDMNIESIVTLYNIQKSIYNFT